MTIIPLNLPNAPLNLKRKDGVVYVRCLVRNKDLVCTPEEWVRQHAIHYLISVEGKKKGLIASEYELNYNGLKRRADIVVFDKNGLPEILIECKATNVSLTTEVLNQAAQYNHKLGVQRVILTNGLDHVECTVDQKNKTLKFNRVWI
ncbi:MAG: type I restriction enzyme HsdR N-terminal domain-containing protein [Crocinitomicaceae bacterium]